MKTFTISYADKSYASVASTRRQVNAESGEHAVETFLRDNSSDRYPHVLIESGSEVPQQYVGNPRFRESLGDMREGSAKWSKEEGESNLGTGSYPSGFRPLSPHKGIALFKPKQHGVAVGCKILGCTNIGVVFIGVFVVVANSSNGWVIVAAGSSAALSCFIVATIIQLLFDCREFLRVQLNGEDE